MWTVNPVTAMNVIAFCLVIYLLSVAACWHLYYNTDKEELDYGVIYCPFFNTVFPITYCVFVIWDEIEELFK
jgi:uncharacterized protein YbaR (Trm112 family)